MQAGSVTVAYPRADTVEGVFCESLTRLLQFDARNHRRVIDGGGVISVASGPLIARARNEIVGAFLRGEGEWLLMVDSDMVFPSDAIERLLAVASDERPVVGALCFAGGRSGRVTPTMYRMLPAAEEGGDPQIGIVEDWERGHVIQVDATGAAFLLIHRSVLEAMAERWAGPSPWFITGFKGNVEFGEDFGFCVRLANLGVPVFVHTGMEIGHSKRHILGLDDFDAFIARRNVFGEEHVLAEALDRREPMPMAANVIPMNRAERRRQARSS